MNLEIENASPIAKMSESSCSSTQELSCSNYGIIQSPDETISTNKFHIIKNDKKEAQAVCGEISRLLRDKCSKTRGSCMFRKRRKRSEKFAIVGYGKKPVENEQRSSDSEASDSVFSSTDDEIEVYDHPGPCNLVEQDINLTSTKKVQNVISEAEQIKGKGAKMFAKRQERMEKYVIGDNSEELEQIDKEKNIVEDLSLNDKNETIDYASENSSSAIETHHYNQNYLQSPEEGIFVPATEMEREFTRKNEAGQLYYSYESNQQRPCEDEFFPDPSDVEISDQITSENEEISSSRKTGFRSVKPPTNARADKLNTELQSLNYLSNRDSEAKFIPTLRNPKKTWSSVKFQPKLTNVTKVSDSQKNVECPFTVSSTENAKTTMASKCSTKPAQSYKSVLTFSSISKPKKNDSHFQTANSSLASVQLLERPFTRTNNDQLNNQINEIVLKQPTIWGEPDKKKSVRGDLTPKSNSPIPFVSDSTKECNYDSPFDSKNDLLSRDHCGIPTEKIQEDICKPKVAACMRLMDPSKGKYEPKTAIVYKQTSAKTNDWNRTHKDKYSKPLQFNKPIPVDSNLPQTSYLDKEPFNSWKYNRSQSTQPLGALAGELKGKGARMFEKQQKRMENFTKESNGSAMNVNSGTHIQIKGPEDKAKVNMSQVVGEFKKVSADSIHPKRPSVTRTTKAKDPYYYHNHYITSHGPCEEDFVISDDHVERGLVSNYSTASASNTSDKILCQNNEEDKRVIYSYSVPTKSSGKNFYESLPSPPAYNDVVTSLKEFTYMEPSILSEEQNNRFEMFVTDKMAPGKVKSDFSPEILQNPVGKKEVATIVPVGVQTSSEISPNMKETNEL